MLPVDAPTDPFVPLRRMGEAAAAAPFHGRRALVTGGASGIGLEISTLPGPWAVCAKFGSYYKYII